MFLKTFKFKQQEFCSFIIDKQPVSYQCIDRNTLSESTVQLSGVPHSL